MKNQEIFGICMAGLEHQMRACAKEACARFHAPVYVEIGVAYGDTLTAMASIIRYNSAPGWVAVGIDIPDGWSLHLPSITAAAERNRVQLAYPEFRKPFLRPQTNAVNIVLEPSQSFLKNYWPKDTPIHLALIDGCHGKPCVTADFTLIEPHVPVGGMVLFHDFGTDSVGESQPHCGPGSGDSLGAARDLGLLDGTRKGWKHVTTVVGDKSRTGRDLGVFERV